MSKILLAEDDIVLAESISDWLQSDRHVVDHLADGLDVAHHLKTASYDLIIMDWQLPGLSGPEICRAYRAAGGQTPILFLTGLGELSDKVIGFDAGADDYLTKPFAGRELLLRVGALLKRPQQIVASELKVADISLNTATKIVTQNGNPISLQPREYQLLEFFLRHPDQTFETDQLLQRVWPLNVEAGHEAVKTTVRKLRQKIDPESVLLQTRHGHGYILVTGSKSLS